MKERDIFLALLDIETEEARNAFLDQACRNDSGLRAKVAALLKSYQDADSFLAEPAVRKFAAPSDEQSSEFEIEVFPQGLSNEVRMEATLVNAAATGDAASIGRKFDEPVLPSGTTVGYFGDYEILKELGRGGMGVVYKARQISLNRMVALKMIRAGFLPGDSELRRFQNEAEAVALLDHPGVIPVYEVGDHKGQRFFSMKLIDGGDLGTQLSFYKNNPQAAVALLAEAADAVHHAHLRGILHRDLKPANILIDAEGHPHVTDFGLAKRVEMDAEMTQSGSILGTPAYMSPEQAAGRRGSITTATDVYGLGAIFYALLTGEAPFSDDSLIETLDAVRTKPPEPPSKINSKVPYDLELICLKCLEKDPARRYLSADALVADLRRFSAGQPVSVRAAGIVEKFVKWARRKPTLAAAYTLGVVALIFGSFGGVALWQWNVAETALRLAEVSQKRARSAQARAVEEKSKAEYSRNEAESSRDESIQARREADALNDQLQNFEYGRTIQYAYQEWHENQVASTLELLERTKAELRGWEWFYVDRLCHSEILTLKGHHGEIRSASFSPDGLRILTSALDGHAIIWNTNTGAPIVDICHEHGAASTFSPDGLQVVTAGQNAVKVWDSSTGTNLLTIHRPRDDANIGTFSDAVFSPDGTRIVASISANTYDGARAMIWDAKSGEKRLAFGRFTASGVSVRFSPDGTRILTTSWDGSVVVSDAATGATVLQLEPSYGIARAAFSPDGSKIVTANGDGKARVWDTSTGTLLRTFFGHTNQILMASFSRDGNRIATSGADGTARIWNANSGEQLLALRGHTRTVDAVSFSPDGSRIVTASADGTAKVWDATAFIDTVTFHYGDFLFCATFSPDGTRILIPCGTSLMAFDLSTNKVNPVRNVPPTTGHFGAFKRDGSQIAVATADGSVLLVDARTETETIRLHGHKRLVRSASYNTDGSRLVTAGEDRTAKVWDTRTGAEIVNFLGHQEQVLSAEFYPDGSRIVTVSSGGETNGGIGFGGEVKIWSPASGVEYLTIPCDATSASVSPNGAWIVTAQSDNTARIWDSVTGALYLTLRGHIGTVRSAAFSPDGSRIVTASDDWKVKLWDARTGAEVLSLGGHSGEVMSARFSSDGSRIVSASFDGTVKVWDAGTKYRELQTRTKSSLLHPFLTKTESPASTLVEHADTPDESQIRKHELTEIFETPVCPPGRDLPSITEWTGPLLKDSHGVTNEVARLPAIPDGNQAAYVNNFPSGTGSPTDHAIARQLDDTLEIETTYKLSAMFGWRKDNIESIGGMELWAGGQCTGGRIEGGTLLASSQIELTQGKFVSGSVVYVTTSKDPHIGERLSIRLTGTPKGNHFAQTNFDQVRLTSAPSESASSAP